MTLRTSRFSTRKEIHTRHARGASVAHAHLRHLNPLPANTEDVLRSYRRVLVPEVNMGHLLKVLRARYLIDATGYNRVRGKPFRIAEIEAEADRILAESSDRRLAGAAPRSSESGRRVSAEVARS